MKSKKQIFIFQTLVEVTVKSESVQEVARIGKQFGDEFNRISLTGKKYHAKVVKDDFIIYGKKDHEFFVVK